MYATKQLTFTNHYNALYLFYKKSNNIFIHSFFLVICIVALLHAQHLQKNNLCLLPSIEYDVLNYNSKKQIQHVKLNYNLLSNAKFERMVNFNNKYCETIS